MIKTFTQNDILRFLYGEMTPSEAEDFEDCLSRDSELKEEYTDQLNLLEHLDKSLIEPREAVINKIREYSAQAKERQVI